MKKFQTKLSYIIQTNLMTNLSWFYEESLFKLNDK